ARLAARCCPDGPGRGSSAYNFQPLDVRDARRALRAGAARGMLLQGSMLVLGKYRMRSIHVLTWALWLESSMIVLTGFVRAPHQQPWLEVDVTAYNSTVAQTDRQPWVAAWGDRLRPGMRSIAVSRDLLHMGLARGSRVAIEGLSGEYVVLDKM